ncbi:MAG TPA: EAL domain-containing protein [Mycobacteriales bacterium]|nr:EAL domain-containing protein [Mycobacteriales bacterium]
MGQPAATDPSPLRAIARVGLAVAAVGATAGWVAHVRPGPTALPSHLSWAVLAVAFAVAQTATIEVQTGRESRSVSLTEIPFVMGLLALSPTAFLVARMTGGSVAQAVLRRQWRNPLKLLFNLLVSSSEASLGLAVLHLAADGSSPDSVRTWAAAMLATTLASLAGALAVATVISQVAGNRCWRETLSLGWWVPALAIGLTATGVVSLLALQASEWSILPLLVVGALVVVAYRGYAGLVGRHGNVERLYTFSRLLGAHAHADSLLRLMLEQVSGILRAESAHLTFVDGTVPTMEVSMRREKPLTRHEPQLLASASEKILERVSHGQSVLVPRSTKAPELRAWLTAHNARDAVFCPVRGESNAIVAVLAVTDRLGETQAFGSADVQMLETVANHASVALRHGELLRQLRHDSLHDGLTGVPNRTHLQRDVERRLASLFQGGAPFAVAMLDLDSFKDVNDTLGHDHGDELLQEVARRLSDAVPSPGIVSRFGGDEFAVLLPDCESDDAAVQRCQSILAALSEPVEIAGVSVDVSASIGIARAPTHAGTWSDLMKRADQAMYVAKRGGREVATFDPSHDTSSPSRLALVVALRRAIAQQQIDIYVQPQVSLATGRVICVEALARWTDAERGPVSPDEFIGLAEKTGLVRPLTSLVLERAIEACAAWQRTAPGLAVAVNLSVHSLRDDGLDTQVADLLERYGLPAELLTLEITETSIMTDPESSRGLLDRLRMLGVRLSIDDFGTGYSSLSQLRRLPVQEVKVDRSFVQRMHEEADDASIVRSIIELARTLELEVVAEGVEANAAMDMLRAMGCHIAQGYAISRPMPVPELGRWLAARSSTVPPPRLLSSPAPTH